MPIPFATDSIYLPSNFEPELNDQRELIERNWFGGGGKLFFFFKLCILIKKNMINNMVFKTYQLFYVNIFY